MPAGEANIETQASLSIPRASFNKCFYKRKKGRGIAPPSFCRIAGPGV
jgi:hypothetical protein